jgi:hypothetical protein
MAVKKTQPEKGAEKDGDAEQEIQSAGAEEGARAIAKGFVEGGTIFFRDLELIGEGLDSVLRLGAFFLPASAGGGEGIGEAGFVCFGEGIKMGERSGGGRSSSLPHAQLDAEPLDLAGAFGEAFQLVDDGSEKFVHFVLEDKSGRGSLFVFAGIDTDGDGFEILPQGITPGGEGLQFRLDGLSFTGIRAGERAESDSICESTSRMDSRTEESAARGSLTAVTVGIANAGSVDTAGES